MIGQAQILAGPSGSGDLSAPAVPTGLRIASKRKNGLGLAWDLVTSDEGPVQAFDLVRSETEDGVYSTFYGSTNIVSLGFLTSADNDPLASNTLYWLKVRAKNSAGPSAYSAAVSGRTLSATAIPEKSQLGDLLIAIRDKIAGIDGINEDDVMIGSIFGIEQRPAEQFPCFELLVDTSDDEQFVSGREMETVCKFLISIHKYTETADRISGADMVSLSNLCSAVKRQIFTFHDEDENPPCDGFLMVMPRVKTDPRYLIYTDRINTAFMEVEIKVESLDTEV